MVFKIGITHQNLNKHSIPVWFIYNESSRGNGAKIRIFGLGLGLYQGSWTRELKYRLDSAGAKHYRPVTIACTFSNNIKLYVFGVSAKHEFINLQFRLIPDIDISLPHSGWLTYNQRLFITLYLSSLI